MKLTENKHLLFWAHSFLRYTLVKLIDTSFVLLFFRPAAPQTSLRPRLPGSRAACPQSEFPVFVKQQSIPTLPLNNRDVDFRCAGPNYPNVLVFVRYFSNILQLNPI